MSGIAGIYNLDGRPVEPALLQRMSNAIAHRGPDGEGHWVQDSVGLSCQLMRVTPESLTETQPLLHSSGSVIVFDGRLDNREEILKAVGSLSAVSIESSDAALVLAAYEAFGDRFPEHLNGDFALGLFDPRRHQLFLVRDAIGVRPLYYCRAGNTFLFASEIKAILAHPQVSTRPNDEMLAAFFFGNRAENYHGFTFFDGISSVIPAHSLVAGPDGFVTKRYWDFDPNKRIRLGSFQEYADEFGRLLKQAVKRRLRAANPVAVSVSGGLDSSSIFCVAENLRQEDSDRTAPVLGLSYTSADGSPSDEKAFLVEIEKQYGSTIERIPMASPGFMDGSPEMVRHVESPLLDLQWNTTSEFMRSVRQRGSRVLLTGHWGDQMLFDQAYLIDLFRRLAWRQILTHLREFRHWMPDVDSKSFSRSLLSDLVTQLPNAVVSPMRWLKAKLTRANVSDRWYTWGFRNRSHRRVPGTATAHPTSGTAHFKSLYHEARSRYHVLCMEWNNKVAAMFGMEMAFPFLDRDLLSFLMCIPGEAQMWQGIHKALLRRSMQGILPSAIMERRGKADFTDLSNEGVHRDYYKLAQYFQSEGRLATQFGYLDADELRREAARLESGIKGPDSLVSWSFRDLIGLELWLQGFSNRNRERMR